MTIGLIPRTIKNVIMYIGYLWRVQHMSNIKWWSNLSDFLLHWPKYLQIMWFTSACMKYICFNQPQRVPHANRKASTLILLNLLHKYCLKTLTNTRVIIILDLETWIFHEFIPLLNILPSTVWNGDFIYITHINIFQTKICLCFFMFMIFIAVITNFYWLCSVQSAKFSMGNSGLSLMHIGKNKEDLKTLEKPYFWKWDLQEARTLLW